MTKTRMARRGFLFLTIVLFGLFSMSCVTNCTKVEPGYAGIRVNQYGSQRGVEDFPLQTGRVWYNSFTEDVYKFPTFLQTVVWTKDEAEGSENDESITFNSSEGAIINADITLAYSFAYESVPSLFVEFRKTAEEITDVYMRSRVRNAFSQQASVLKVADIFGEKKQTMLNDVKNQLIEELSSKGINIDMVSYVGALRVDPIVEASINAVIQAKQKAIEAENKVAQATAEANQVIEAAEGEAQAIQKVADADAYAIRARSLAQAEANNVVRESLINEGAILLQWEQVRRWNGVVPTVSVTSGGDGGGIIPLLQIPMPDSSDDLPPDPLSDGFVGVDGNDQNSSTGYVGDDGLP